MFSVHDTIVYAPYQIIFLNRLLIVVLKSIYHISFK